jgi:hypothetical protein
MANSKWRDEAIRKSLRNLESRRQAELVKEGKRSRVKRKGRKRDGGIVGSSDVCNGEVESEDNGNDNHRTGDLVMNKVSTSTLAGKNKRETRKERFRRIMNELYHGIKDAA